jgi:uncharacterized damage-inducible protein DinB
MNSLATALLVASALVPFAQAQTQQPPVPAKSFSQAFGYVNHKILEMAEDFPEAKYGFRLTKETRSFQEMLIHVASGNVYAAKAGRGEKVNWDELDTKNYATKAETVAALRKSIEDATATLKAVPDERFAKTVEPWLAVIEHAAEHYGQLVANYRASGLVPPDSRPKAK